MIIMSIFMDALNIAEICQTSNLFYECNREMEKWRKMPLSQISCKMTFQLYQTMNIYKKFRKFAFLSLKFKEV